MVENIARFMTCQVEIGVLSHIDDCGSVSCGLHMHLHQDYFLKVKVGVADGDRVRLWERWGSGLGYLIGEFINRESQ